MVKGIRWFAIVAAALLVVGAAAVSADDLSASGRQVVTKWQSAVVTVQLVVRTTMSMPGEASDKKEDKVETTGTIIDPSGLTVVSLSAVSPGDMVSRIMYQDMSGVKITSDITDLKLLLSDGQTLPGAVVLRDKDLDLAFIRPKQKPASSLPSVDLSAPSMPQLLDDTITLYRLGTVGSRSIAACVDRVQAIIEKPRTLYSQGLQAMSASLGSPVFAMDANPIGILVMRTLPGGMSSGSRMSTGIGGMGMMYVVLPAADVADAAKQAPQSAPATPTAATPSPAPTPKPATARKPTPAK
jgi:hypothetical protein